jgi:hypothetical protein
MSKVTQFPSFKVSYEELRKNLYRSLNIEFYHHDFSGEPTHTVHADLRDIYYEKVDEHGLVISLQFDDTALTFTEKNHHTNLSNGAVVFSSKHDSETYWIIEFS